MRLWDKPPPHDTISRVDAELELVATKRRLLIEDPSKPGLLDAWQHLCAEADRLLDRRLTIRPHA